MSMEARRRRYADIFVYMGGDQEVPRGIMRARIHKSVKTIRAGAFQNRVDLMYLEFHDGVEIIEEWAFDNCHSLRGSIKLLGVKTIKAFAFYKCRALRDVEFGDKLETIEGNAFGFCSSLKSIKIPSIRTIGKWAFHYCNELLEMDLPEELETLHRWAFETCPRLRRIALPLKDDMIGDDAFDACPNLTSVDLVGGIHYTVASMYMDCWRKELTGEINRINEVLSNPHGLSKTQLVQQWMNRVIRRLDHYKAEHHKILKEATTLLELALWKANLDENEGDLATEGVLDGERRQARKEICVTSGASIVIKNVLPFLQLK